MSTEERVIRLENAFSTLIELARVQSERLDEPNERLTALGNNLTALSQIVVEIAQGQRRADERLDRLAALVEQHIGGA